MKILLKSSLVQGTGRGEDSFELIPVLQHLGIDVYLDPVGVKPPIPPRIAALLSKPYPLTSFDLALHYIEPHESGISKYFKPNADVKVLWTGIENSYITRYEIRQPFTYYDAVFATDEASYGAIRSLYGNELPLGVLMSGYDAEQWKPVQRNWDNGFIFLMALSGDSREKPELAIQQFHNLQLNFPDEMQDVQLVIRTVSEDTLNVNLVDHVRNLIIIKGPWTTNENFKNLYKSAHCMIVLDSGGMKNRAALEFMSTGGSVIATNYSLNKGWMSNAYCYSLKYELVAKSKKDQLHKIVEPDAYDLQNIMLQIVRNREDVKRKGKIAADVIPAMLDWSKVVDDFFLRLNELLPGSSIYDKYQRLQSVEEENGWKI